MNWNSLNKESQLNGIIEASHAKPQLIFKHSRTCPISSMAKARLESDEGRLSQVDSYYLDLLTFRNVSNAVAEKLGVHHESPQVILINQGEVSYDESHLDISVEELEEHFNYLANQ